MKSYSYTTKSGLKIEIAMDAQFVPATTRENCDGENVKEKARLDSRTIVKVNGATKIDVKGLAFTRQISSSSKANGCAAEINAGRVVIGLFADDADAIESMIQEIIPSEWIAECKRVQDIELQSAKISADYDAHHKAVIKAMSV